MGLALLLLSAALFRRDPPRQPGLV